VVGRGWLELERAAQPSPFAVRRVLSHDDAKVPFAEDQHPVGRLGPDDGREPFGISVWPWTSGRDLGRLDAGAGQDRVE
jgi:hypothetical protein